MIQIKPYSGLLCRSQGTGALCMHGDRVPRASGMSKTRLLSIFVWSWTGHLHRRQDRNGAGRIPIHRSAVRSEDLFSVVGFSDRADVVLDMPRIRSKLMPY